MKNKNSSVDKVGNFITVSIPLRGIGYEKPIPLAIALTFQSPLCFHPLAGNWL
ncbi:hypothetical protein [Sphaerospermopsis reniformis]|uniref:hypothetical protein n=1 Tax=Sphaerospermopsis reniformis TaxID=531300 RepID=UPI003FCD4481